VGIERAARATRLVYQGCVLAVLALTILSFPRQAQAKTLTEKWRTIDGTAVTSILAGQNKAPFKKLDRLVKQMVERLGPGVGGEQLMAQVLMHRALAEAGLGETEDALWDWHVALNMSPSLADRDLGRFGKAGALLASNSSWLPSSPADEDEREEDVLAPSAEPPGIQPPRMRRRIRPDFPYGARYFQIQGPIVVQMIISQEGEVTAARVLKDLDAAALTYVVFQEIRKARFRSALLDGKPIAVYFNLTFNYRLH